MLKKILAIFTRDLRVNTRDFIALYIIVFPILFAIVINIFVPGINDTTVNVALLSQDKDTIGVYLADFAKVETFDSREALEARILKRDNIIGLLPDGDSYSLLTQGNEPESVIEFTKMLNTFYQLDVSVSDTQAKITEFGRVIPPMKRVFVNTAIMLISILGGMLIALNIVEEKVDNTISAMHVTPVTRSGFIIGKSMIGVAIPIIGTTIMLVMTGFSDVNFFQILLMLATSAILSLLVGFIEGLTNDDIMSAAGNIKILFLPLLASVAAIEILADKWQKFFYWIPFYWTYKANDMILAKSGTWPDILSYAGFVLAISAVVFVVLAPKIRKGLE